MPLKWVEPDLFFTHLGINVYCTYRNNDYNNPYEYWFTTDITEDFENDCDFDIRDLNESQGVLNLRDFKDTLKKAIEKKKLQLPNNIEYTH